MAGFLLHANEHTAQTLHSVNRHSLNKYNTKVTLLYFRVALELLKFVSLFNIGTAYI